MGRPAAANLDLYQGDTFSAVVTIVGENGTPPPDITGWDVTAQIRSDIADRAGVAATFTATISAPQQILLSLSAAETGGLSAGGYRWDLELDNGGVVTTVLAGAVRVLPEVSRP